MQLQTIGSAMVPTMWIRETKKESLQEKKKERKLRSEEQSEAMKRERKSL